MGGGRETKRSGVGQQDQQSDEELSTLVETGTGGIGLSREEADWANLSSSAATSPGRLTKFSLSGEPGTGDPSFPDAGALDTLTRSRIATFDHKKTKQNNPQQRLADIPPD